MSLSQKALSLCCSSLKLCHTTSYSTQKPPFMTPNIHMLNYPLLTSTTRCKLHRKLKPLSASLSVEPPLDLTEDNVRQALVDARGELGQIFDTSVGMTGVVELVELDGPYVTISLKGRFWHKRSTVLARLANYLKQRIPEILEVDIENEKQLDDSPANF
ncbi:hypothetical protein MtrunA17_Chr7g0267161 [Medicago truncatula]|uniref:Uncharacterized protein n=1 Tax=Medicago truncatula TaxID=3880 RepID=A0A072UEI1_MEDTR|nr:uncharacterized protein LOC25499457 isoform X1 [Medicago truncatula]XP_024625856.1 uncharacterized protein LOC25499457 isoform X1 [Medicago truncatula]XP_024625857.1 uncharacterized protein LOC25499457 isoform X1 [Medicago truncatula]KEH24210.1 hypothetical protein MTR_7g105840 [Medicago truncatula]RHN48756.1 hypothetical protein MtrunA17_Chr7g0267161 [Medicago truncatula]